MKILKESWSAHVLTLFPEMFPGPLGLSITGKALKKRIWSLKLVNLRDFSNNGPKNVDDTPYGGGSGMIIKSDVVHKAIKNTIKNLVLLCGKYEGIDQRVIDKWNIEEISIGDYILSGGEIAAMNLIDSCVRLLPNVLGSSQSLENETFENNLLEYPQYTKPRSWLGKKVPNVLLSGNHEKIKEWRKKESLRITKNKRPDLLQKVIKK